MSHRSKNNRKNWHKNKQTHSNNNNRKTKTSTSTNNNNDNNKNKNKNKNNNNNKISSNRSHASSKPLPHSRRILNKREGQLSSETQSSLEHSTWNRPQRRDGIENLKLGSPYNEYNSFFSECSPDQIFNELTLILKSEENLDINIHPTGYKIRGRKFIENIMCEFQIEMFFTTSKHKQYPNHILVEFQRRNGDGFVFQQFLNNVFTELQKTKIVKFSKFNTNSNCILSPNPLTININTEQDEKKQNDDDNNNNNNNNYNDCYNYNNNEQIDYNTLKMLIGALFNGNCNMRRSAATYLANNIVNNNLLIGNIIKLEPLIITKFSDLLLKCVDPQIVQSIGCTLYYMLIQSNDLKLKAIQSNVKSVCKKVYKRWTEPVETRYGSNNKYIIRVIPSMQVAQRMSACIQVLE